MKIEKKRLAYVSRQSMVEAIVCSIDLNGAPDTPDSREVFKMGGKELEAFSHGLSSISVSQAVIAPGFNLQNKWVILTRSPHYMHGTEPEVVLLKTWQSILRLCAENQVRSLAAPVIGVGSFEFPTETAVNILVKAFTQDASELAPDLESIHVCLPISVFELEFDAAMQLSEPADQRPRTVEAAVEYLMKTMLKSTHMELAALPEDQLIQTHYGLAAEIRNGLLRQNPALYKATGYRHRDDASGEIVRALWTRLCEKKWLEEFS